MKDIIEMTYVEFRKAYHGTLKKYPGMECAYNPHYEYIMQHTKFEKVGAKWIEKESERYTETITGQHFMNIIDAMPFFRNLGGKERVTMGYTLAGYIPVQLDSIAPDGTEKIVRKFRPIQK